MGLTESIITIVIGIVMVAAAFYVVGVVGDKLIETANAAGTPLPETVSATIAIFPTLMNVMVIVFGITVVFVIFQSFTSHNYSHSYPSEEPSQPNEVRSGQIINPTFVHNARETTVVYAYGGGGGGVQGIPGVNGMPQGASQIGGQYVHHVRTSDGWEPVEVQPGSVPEALVTPQVIPPVSITTETLNKHEPKRTRYNTLFEEDTVVK